MPKSRQRQLGFFVSIFFLVLIGRVLSDTAHSDSDLETTPKQDVKLHVFTVATDEQHEGFIRFNRSLRYFGYDDATKGSTVTVLSDKKEGWKGGDVKRGLGGGQKVRLLRDALAERYPNSIEDIPEDEVILFVDSYDVILADYPAELLKRFEGFDGVRLLFSAEPYCWPEKSLESQYPKLPTHLAGHGARFLNSGGFIGYAQEVVRLLREHAADIKDTDDDQLFYTKLFLNESIRSSLKMGLDYGSKIFQNLNGAQEHVQLKYTEAGNPVLINTHTQSTPMIVHGNGPAKGLLSYIGNYLAGAWTPKDGCGICKDPTRPGGVDSLLKRPDAAPRVLIGIFILRPTPFMDEFFTTITRLQYPKDRISIMIQNNVQFHSAHVKNFIAQHSAEYETIELKPNETTEWKARNALIEECFKIDCSYYLSLDSEARLDNSRSLLELIDQDRWIVAPLLARPGKLWSTFWGALTPDGFYSRSPDYVELVKGKRRGLWNVPHISTAYLIKGDLIRRLIEESQNSLSESSPSSIFNHVKLSYYNENDPEMDADMAFTHHIRESDGAVVMWVSNQVDYGHLVATETFNTSLYKPEMYEIQENPLDWEQRYLHADYIKLLNHVPKEGDSTTHMVDMVPGLLEEPCRDVYWFPLVSETFTRDLVAMMEHFGQWSDGTNSDPRLAGGYENVPTRDIHMNQVAFDAHWLHFLRAYVKPIQEKVFIGYYHDPPKAIMNFVVRYHPEEQPQLRPHHDSSTYTLNIALNRGGGVDYEGGGCRFLRYNCSVTNTRPGWALIHPGRLTHLHEGLPVTSGTRYIMISFIDP